MKVVFTVDNYFYKSIDGKVYSKGLYPYSVWQRYLKVFDEIVVIARMLKLDEDRLLNKMNLSSGPKVTFVSIPSLNSPIKKINNYGVGKTIINNILIDSDCLIARIPSETSSLAIKVAQKLGKPWAVEVVSCTWDAYWNHGSLKGKIYAPFATLRTKKETLRAKYALYVTENFLQQRYPSNGQMVNCSNVEIDEVGREVLDKRLALLDHEKKPINIGFIGYLGTDIKGMDTALKALSIVNQSYKEFEFHVLGAGDPYRWVQMAKDLGLSEKIIFHGFIPAGAPVLEWIDNIDLYIHPSRQEGLPRAVIEVMSRGCPIVASNVGGIPELLNDECLHDPNDYKMMAEKIKTILSNESFRIKMTKHNFNKAKCYYKAILDNRRTEFWESFRAYCEIQNAKTVNE